MSTLAQSQSRTTLNPPTTVRYQIVWQETPTRRPEPGEGDVIITVTDITAIGQGSGSQTPQYTAVAKLTWGRWEANFGCTYYPIPSILVKFKCLRMNDAMRNEVQGRDLDSDEERKDDWDDAEPKILTAAVDDHDNWMLKVEVGGAVGTKDVSYFRQTQGVNLWAKRVVGDGEEVTLSRAEKDRLHIE
ncbi:MAG: hypothetical protein ALECFALPRED_005757 [Alectoria fallacina]|uniref:Uncharacterized protein n=1 Tax=Alectoria fallacina TaxID=1903189 RepID=A0A8H3IU84_9LECA|nr:MAG: hypothetical protein ALECFALPRED_005757 [Alectoria fallacina]